MSGQFPAAAYRRCPHCGHRHNTIANIDSIAANMRKRHFTLTDPAPALDAPPADGNLILCVSCGNFSFLHLREGKPILLVTPSREQAAMLRRDPVLHHIHRLWRRNSTSAMGSPTASRRRLNHRLRAAALELPPVPTRSTKPVLTGVPAEVLSEAPARIHLRIPKRHRLVKKAAEPPPRRDKVPDWPLIYFDSAALIRHNLTAPAPQTHRLQAQMIEDSMQRQGQDTAHFGTILNWVNSGTVPEEQRLRMLVAAVSRAEPDQRTTVFANCFGWDSTDLTALVEAELVDGGMSGLSARLALNRGDLRRPARFNMRAILDSAGRTTADVIDWLTAYGQDADIHHRRVAGWFTRTAADKYIEDYYAARLLFVLICADQMSLREAIGT